MILSIWELVPFRVLRASSCSCQASDPYESMLHSYTGLVQA